MTKIATSKNEITELFKVDGMNVLALEPMEVGPEVKAKTFSPEHKGGNRKKARGVGAATSGLTFRGGR